MVKSYYEYIEINNAKLFTIALIPDNVNKCPIIVYRSPYVDDFVNKREEEFIEYAKKEYKNWLENGYGVVFQHCRGTGKSTGDCIPYINEREDGLKLHDWIRKQPFYDNELYLVGGSYCASVHMVTSPFKEDIKGAILIVQDNNRYNCNYRNGFYKIGLHGNWYVSMYKKKSIYNKNFDENSFKMLPLIDFSKNVFGEEATNFNEVFMHPNKEDEFWKTHSGGAETLNFTNENNIPILFLTGFYDIYCGGIFEMFKKLNKECKEKSALIVFPYDHGCDPNSLPIVFKDGTLNEHFKDYQLSWINYIRKKEDCIVKLNTITYYSMFENCWKEDDFLKCDYIDYTLGDNVKTYKYDPSNPCVFKGGLSNNFGGNPIQDKINRNDVITIYTKPFDEDIIIHGKMKVQLKVSSDCKDTCFYIRISLCKKEFDFGLRDDINMISNFTNNYIENSEIEMDFNFDEISLKALKGEKLRIDITSSAYPLFVPHTNNLGLFFMQKDYKIANNSVNLSKSIISIPIKRKLS